MDKEIKTPEELMESIAESMDNSTLIKRVRNTLSSLISTAYGENDFDLGMYEYSDKQEALKVLNEVIDLIESGDTKVISTNRYECRCGAHFKISRENGENSIKCCPYCAVDRKKTEDCSFDGEFCYDAIRRDDLEEN